MQDRNAKQGAGAPDHKPQPAISADEAKAIVATKIHPKVTEASITDKITTVSYILLDAPGDPFTPFGTLCIITMENGWVSTGFSAPASIANFDPQVGERYAYDNAFKPLWQLEGYLLRERLYQETLNEETVGEGQRRDYRKEALSAATGFAAGVGEFGSPANAKYGERWGEPVPSDVRLPAGDGKPATYIPDDKDDDDAA
jgi:hypothetical protein